MSHIDAFRVLRARAKVLAGADRKLRKDLIEVRRNAGLTQADVAAQLGCTQQAIQKLERYDADPKLSTLRRYANAVGALVEHHVTVDRGQSLWMASAGRSGEPAGTSTSHATQLSISTVSASAPTAPVSPTAGQVHWASGRKRSEFALAG